VKVALAAGSQVKTARIASGARATLTLPAQFGAARRADLQLRVPRDQPASAVTLIEATAS